MLTQWGQRIRCSNTTHSLALEDLQAAYGKLSSATAQKQQPHEKLLKLLHVTFSTGVTDPSLRVKRSEIDSD